MSLFKKRVGRRNIRSKAVQLEDEHEGDDNGEMTSTTGGEVIANKPPPVVAPTKKKNESRALLSFNDELNDEGPEIKLKKTSQSRRAAKIAERERREKKMKNMIESLNSGVEGDGGSGGESEEEEEGPGHLISLSQQLRGGFIPNADFIHRARKEREERRQMGDAPAVIPLSTNQKVQVAKGKSRLVREDDDDKSDESEEEERGRRRMDAGNHDTAAVKQLQVLQGLEEMGSDEDEETRRWEEEQIMKGVKASAPDQGAPPTSAPSHLTSIEQSFLMGSVTGPYIEESSYMTPSYMPAVQAYAGVTPEQRVEPQVNNSFQIPDKLVPITLESLKSRLKNQLCDLQDSASGHRERLQQIGTDVERSRDEVGGAEGRRGDLGRRYQFYQEMRGYLRDLLCCLGEKEPVIGSMERAVEKVRKERADLLLARRRQDITDMDNECAQTDSVQQIPLLGDARRRAVEREGRRRRRRERREKEQRASEEHRQGMSSDDELLEINRVKFQTNMSKAVSRADEVFSDVVEDFCDLSHIKQRLEQWKFQFPDSYSHAHIPLYLPQLFSPYIRLEMLQWNLLEDDCPDFEAMNWFKLLMFYGFQEGVELDPNDPDSHLIPELIDRVIVPRITLLVRSVWDPLSSRQTRHLTLLIRQLSEDYPTVTSSRPNTQSLFTAVLCRLRRATEKDVFIPLYTRTQVENSLSPRAIFYSQQFWSCVKLLGNITEWEGLVAPDALQELALEGLLNRYLILSLQTCPYTSQSVVKTEAVTSRVPITWMADGATVTRPLQSLVSCISQLAEQLHRSSIGHPDHLRQKTRLLIKDLTEQLVRIGATTESNSLREHFHLT